MVIYYKMLYDTNDSGPEGSMKKEKKNHKHMQIQKSSSPVWQHVHSV